MMCQIKYNFKKTKNENECNWEIQFLFYEKIFNIYHKLEITLPDNIMENNNNDNVYLHFLHIADNKQFPFVCLSFLKMYINI